MTNRNDGILGGFCVVRELVREDVQHKHYLYRSPSAMRNGTVDNWMLKQADGFDLQAQLDTQCVEDLRRLVFGGIIDAMNEILHARVLGDDHAQQTIDKFAALRYKIEREPIPLMEKKVDDERAAYAPIRTVPSAPGPKNAGTGGGVAGIG